MIHEEKLIQFALSGSYDQLRSQGITAEYFTNFDLRNAWSCISSVGDAGKTIEKDIVIAWMQDRGFGTTKLEMMPDRRPEGAELREFITLAQRSYDRRYWQRQAKELAEKLPTSSDPNALLGSLANEIIEYQMGKADQGATAADAMPEWSSWIKANKAMDPSNTLTSGLRGIDGLHGRFQPKRLYVIAARPGAGKSAICHYLSYLFAKQGHKVGIFSLEMSRVEILARMVAMESGVNSWYQDFPSEATPEQINSIAEASKTISGELGKRLFINDQASLTLYQVKAIARSWVYSKGVKAIVVDYLQLLKSSSRSRDNRTQEIAEVAEGLKQIAKELDVPVIAPAQSNRQYEIEGRKPRLSDLGESSGIEKAADSIAFLIEGQTESQETYLEYYVAKQRAGQVGSAFLEFEKPTTTFRDFRPA